MASIQKYETKKGVFYRAIVYAGIDPDTGKQVNVQKRGFKTRKSANQWADKTRVAIARGERKAAPERMTIDALYTEWSAMYKLTVKPNTYIKTSGYFDNHIMPPLQGRLLTSITPAQCQALVGEWYDKLHHFRQLYQYLKRMFDYAITHGYMTKNPCAKLTIPKAKTTPAPELPKYWDKHELKAFLQACQDDPRPMVYPLFRLLSYTGLRRGELLALEWSDINFDKGTLNVRQAMTKDLDKRVVIGTPKNATSARTIPLDSETLTVMREWQDLAGGTRFVFEGRTGKPMTDSLPRKWLGQVCEVAGVRPINIHGLRHTHCTLLFEAGMLPKEVQDRLGHATAEMTLNIYTHLSTQRKAEVPQKFADFMQV